MKDIAARFLPKKVKDVEEILLEEFSALKVSKEDERLKFHLQDPFCPAVETIYGVYLVYKKSILELLEGRIPSVNSYELIQAKQGEKTLTEEDLAYLLDAGTLIVLASKREGLLTSYFYTGASERLDSLFNLCMGYSRDLEKKKYKTSLERFLKDIRLVERMGLLDRIIDN